MWPPSRDRKELGKCLDVVQSCVADDDDNNTSDDCDDGRGCPDGGGSGCELPPQRAYSVGSRPAVTSHTVVSNLNGGLAKSQRRVQRTTLNGGNDDHHHHQSDVSVETCTSLLASETPSQEQYSGASTTTVVEQCEMRPRTLTFPWDLLRSRGCIDVERQRPRSASNGSETQLKDRMDSVKRRLLLSDALSPYDWRSGIGLTRDGKSAIRGDQPFSSANDRTQLSAVHFTSDDMCEYVEMNSCHDVNYIDMTVGRGASSSVRP